MSAPPGQDQDFEFDFAAREAQLGSIVDKWKSRASDARTWNYIGVIVVTLRDAAFRLVDEGHRAGDETIKRNFDFAEVTGHLLAAFSLAGYCLGMEYGSCGMQQAPVNDPETVPLEVKEMFVVAFQPIERLFERLITDIYYARGIDEAYVKTAQLDFNATAMEVLLSCYRLGVATATEERR
jgi:hypothetical protein